mmetsp:Transcript_778/g.4832  ORF Transcript_778/g.4832 Transcript_778/m.4832 type:complete len:84 (+) Transcript_778:180-431(+)
MQLDLKEERTPFDWFTLPTMHGPTKRINIPPSEVSRENERVNPFTPKRVKRSHVKTSLKYAIIFKMGVIVPYRNERRGQCGMA